MSTNVYETCWNSFSIWTRLSFHHSRKYSRGIRMSYMLRFLSMAQILILTFQNLDFDSDDSKFIFQPLLRYFNSIIGIKKIQGLLNTSASINIATVILVLYFLFLLITVSLTFAFAYKRPDTSKSIEFASMLTSLHTEILFFPICFALIINLEALLQNKVTVFLQRNFRIVILTTLFVINAAIALFKTLLCYSPINLKGHISQKGSLHLFGVATLKLLLPILHLPALRNIPYNQTSCEVASVIMAFVMSFYIWLYSITKLPEYDLKTMKLQATFNSLLLGLSTTQIITLIFKDQGLALSIAFFVFPFWVRLNLNFFNKIVKRLSFHPETTKNLNYLVHSQVIYTELEQTLSFNYKNPIFTEQTFNGHWLISKIDLGALSDINFHKNGILAPDNDMIIFLKKQYERLQLRHSSNSLASLAHACLLLKYFHMIPKAYYLCLQILNKKLNIPEKISALEIVLRVHKILQKRIRDQSKEVLSFKLAWDHFSTENAFDELKSLMSKYTQTAVDFWKIIKANDSDIYSFINKARSLDSQRRIIDSHWKKYEAQFYRNLPLAFLVYGINQSQFSNKPWEGSMKIKKFNQLALNHNLLTNMPNDDDSELSSVVIISSDKKTIGVVINISEEFYKMCGIEKKLIIGKNISKIMPSFFSERHNQFLLNYIETGKERVIGRETRIYVKDINNNIFPAFLTVILQPSSEHGVVFSALLRKINSQEEYILYNEEGIIEEVSAKIRALIDMEQDKKINIQSLFLESGQDYGQPYSATFLTKANSKKIYLNCKVKIDTYAYSNTLNVMTLSFKDNINDINRGKEENLEEEEESAQLDINRYTAPTRATKNIFENVSNSKFFTEAKKAADLPENKNITEESSFIRKFFTDAFVQANAFAADASSSKISLKSQTKIADNIQNMLEKSYSDKSRRIITGIFTLLILINITILFVQYFTFQESVDDIKFAVDIVGSSYERLNALSWIYRYAIRYQAIVANVATVTTAELDRYKSVIASNRQAFKDSNTQLITSISTSLENKQKVFYQKNIKFTYDNQTNSLQEREISCFDAINELLENLMKFDITPHAILFQAGNPNLEFVRKNSANSLLLSSEAIIEITKMNLFDESDSKQSLLSIVFSISIPIAVVGTLIVIVACRESIKNIKKLSNTISSIQHTEIDVTISKLEFFNKILTNKQRIAKSQLKNAYVKKSEVNAKTKNHFLPRKKFNITLLLSMKLKHTFLSALLLSSFLVINFLNYNYAVTKFDDLLDINNRFLVASKARYSINMASATVFDLIVFRNTTKMRNEPLSQQLDKNLDDIIPSETLYKVFSNGKEGLIDSSLETLFRGKPCSLVVNYPGSNNPINCPRATNNESFGIFTVNSQYPLELYYIAKEMLSNLSFENSQVMYPKMVNTLSHKTSTLVGAYIYVIELMQQIFSQEIDSIFNNGPKRLALETTLMSILGIITVWFLYLRMLDDSDVRAILKLIPYSEIAKNKGLKILIKNLYKTNEYVQNINNFIDL